jgi:hypothetical protein
LKHGGKEEAEEREGIANIAGIAKESKLEKHSGVKGKYSRQTALTTLH